MRGVLRFKRRYKLDFEKDRALYLDAFLGYCSLEIARGEWTIERDENI